MLFNSVAFLVFLPSVVLLYYLLPQKFRWLLLLLCSYLFYAWWRVEYLPLILLSTVVDYWAARKIHRSERTPIRRLWLAISMCVNLGVLAFFKYLILFLPEKDPMLLTIYMVDHPILGVIVHGLYFAIPVGISFYTFQTMSYTLDVYYGKTEPEDHPGYFALFVSFFPQLVAGPIERFSHLMPQLKTKQFITYERMSKAFKLLIFGFFLKICIADNLAPIVDQVYEDPLKFDLLSRWLGTLAFGFQIYTDFAGYTLIAQGAACMLGIDLMDNFRTPYLSSSISEFWKRWHISLSTWFRDYLYLPLGGNRVKTYRWIFNILLVFAVSGFWHGANWTFMIWGCIHGMLYLLERFVWGKPKADSSKLSALFHGIRTFILVNFAWIFFRSASAMDASNHISSLFESAGEGILEIQPYLYLLIALFLFAEFWLYNSRIDVRLNKVRTSVRWAVYAFMLFAVTAWGGVANHPFIYFQF